MRLPKVRQRALTFAVGLGSLGCADSTTPAPAADGGLQSERAQRAERASYTLAYEDPLFQELFIDIDEWRDEPVRHRYVHGGFTDTEARFSIYFPPEDRYEGRFFQYILPVPGNEHAVSHPEYPDPSYSVAFAVDSGAYLVETNGGALTGFGTSTTPCTRRRRPRHTVFRRRSRHV